jgi:polyferredoxin
MKLVPQAPRRKLQWLALAFLLTPLVRLTYLDIDQTKLVLLGLPVKNDRIYLILLLALAVVGTIFFLSAKWGRFFCAYLCPVHLCFESEKRYHGQTLKKHIFKVLPFLLAQSAICFVFPYSRQLQFLREGAFPQPILIAHLIVLGILSSIFYVYRAKFCHSGCPYGVFQNVLRADHTVVTVYQDPDARCVECFACDRACPMELDVREQSYESFCSNCTLCIDACSTVLGDGKEVITQIREDELPDDLAGPPEDD